MIRMVQSKSVGHAKAYFQDALSKSDYYVSDQELPGVWQGKLSDRLGLAKLDMKQAFHALCDNLHPTTGKSLTAKNKQERTAGYDINIHCPKSVSIVHALSNDDHILKAFRNSVDEVMKVIEADAKTRVRKGGANEDRVTGELAYAHFVHQTARPVGDHLPDPHLHSHCFVFNATWDAQENKFKAGQFRDIKRDMPYYQAMFHMVLADKLIDLGYQTRQTAKSFEIVGVPQKVIDQFSKRTDEIGRVAKEKGITDAKELSELGAKTRAKKQKGLSMEELKEGWRDQVKSLGAVEKSEGQTVIRHTKAPVKETRLTAMACIDHALLHCFERASVMPERRILVEAFKHGLGNGSFLPKEVVRQFKEDQRIIHVKEKSGIVCTTKEVLSEEKRMVALAKKGQGKMKPLYAKVPDLKLTGQQAAAVAHVLTTPHRVSIVRGSAGAGKTTLMKEAFKKIQEVGKKVIVVAPSVQASRGVLRDEGFQEAQTVARLLFDEKMQEDLKGQVLWVDEAGLMGTKDMVAVLELVERVNARVIFGGDTRQHAAVVRGDALRILNTVGGIATAEVNKIFRQQNLVYRSAVQDLVEGNVSEAFQKLDSMGSIKHAGHEALAKDYLATLKEKKSALVISPTHADGEMVTEKIRDLLREKGMIGKKEVTVRRLQNLNLTEAEKKDARNFEVGQVVQFSQNAPDFVRGSQWKVDSVNEHGVLVTNGLSLPKYLPLRRSKAYEVYAEREVGLSKGDKVRITRGGDDLNERRLDNGDMLEVVSVTKKGNITLRNEKSKSVYVLPQSFGHIAHAHCITSHASQGKTVHRVFISQPSEAFGATDTKQFYVSVSRGKESVSIYTDDKEELLRRASEMNDRQSALELVKRGRSESVFGKMIETQIRIKDMVNIQRMIDRDTYEPEI